MSVVQELLAKVEAARRAENYGEMFANAGILTLALITNASRDSRTLQSKMYYELHMASYQQAMKSEGDARTELLKKSQRLVERSAAEAVRAGDTLGTLFAQMNMSGLILPTLGKGSEAGAMSSRVCHAAEAIASTESTSEEDKKRAWRIAMNTYFHRIAILIANWDPSSQRKGTVERLLHGVEQNPIYVAQKDEDWAKKAVADAEKFLRE